MEKFGDLHWISVEKKVLHSLDFVEKSLVVLHWISVEKGFCIHWILVGKVWWFASMDLIQSDGSCKSQLNLLTG